MRPLLFSLILLFLCSAAFAQRWVELMQDPNASLPEIQAEFNEYWKTHEQEKGKGYKQFRRWEHMMRYRVGKDGKLPDSVNFYFMQALESQGRFLGANQIKEQSSTGNWSPLGPVQTPTNGLGYPHEGIGRVNCIEFHPTNSNIIWVGSPSGGLWKTTNGGTSWTTNTDFLNNLGVSDIAIDPVNPQVMYIATGDYNGRDTYSFGLLKSSDGGNNWTTTGLSYTVTQLRKIAKILIDPTNTSTLIVATSSGVYRSTNAGTAFTLVSSSSLNVYDLEFKPGNTQIVYASTYNGTIYKSSNNGTSWANSSTGLPTGGNRIELSVTAANASYIYCVVVDATNGLRGIYRSTNEGVNWSLRADQPNILHNSGDGSGTGGQGWYDLVILASPTDVNTLYVGGVNLWKSTDGGLSWFITGHWTGQDADFIHADHHALELQPGTNTIFGGNDGGIFKSTNNGATWINLSSTLSITQFYRISGSATDESIVYGGAQDNGTNRKTGTNWRAVFGGDGMECLVDYTNPDIVYVTSQYGHIRKSFDGGDNFVDAYPKDGDWITPYVMHPTNNNILFAGYDQIYKTIDGADSWNQLGTISGKGTENFTSLAVAVSNPNYIYAAYNDINDNGNIFRTINGGSSWTEVSAGLPGEKITYIAISNLDPQKIWVTLSGYTSGTKVYASTNGGASWTNFSTGLPNLPANCIVFQNGGSLEGLYVGTDIGVYYRNNTMASWQPFMTNLPNVIVHELEIHYASGKLRAATFGRGLWESDLFETPGPAYCTPVMLNPYDNEFISRVVAGSIDNTSGNAASIPYEDYSGLTTNVIAGTNLPVSITGRTTYPDNYTARVYVDWNNNYSFSDAGENNFIGSQAAIPNGNTVFANNVPVPSGQAPGVYRMRCFFYWTASDTINPCYIDFGEFEDYSIRVVGPFDVKVDSIVSPVASSCGSRDVSFQVRINNISDSTINLANTNIELNIVVTGPGSITSSYNRAFNNGTMNPQSSSVFTIATSYDMSAAGSYTVKAFLGKIAGDMNAVNDTTITSRTVLLKPLATINPSGTQGICPGATLTLTSSSAINNRWLFNNVAITSGTGNTWGAFQSGSYKVIVTGANGCFDTSAATVVNVFPSSPPKPTITQNGHDLISSANSGNQWTNVSGVIPGAVNKIYSPSVNGIYKVQVTDNNGCISPISDQYVYSTFGLSSVENGKTLIFPNPAFDVLNIETQDKIDVNSIRIVTVLGEQIPVKIIQLKEGNKFQIALDALAGGVYFVAIDGAYSRFVISK